LSQESIKEKEIKMDKNGSSRMFVKGFVIGGVIGAAAALLTAPQSGEVTRTQIRDKGVELKEKAEATYASMQKQIEETTAQLHTKMDDLAAKIDEYVVQMRGDLSQKVADVAKEVAPEEPEADESPAVEEAVAG
jgi:gas vesicle protein